MDYNQLAPSLQTGDIFFAPRNKPGQLDYRCDHDGVRFFNPDHPDTDRSLRQMLKWKLGEKQVGWPNDIPSRQVQPDARVEGLRVTMVGHATSLVEAAGLDELTDPDWPNA